MLTATEIAGFAGAGLAGAAYVPQIAHLIRARCAAGISRLAFAAWLLASVLTTTRAIAIHAAVFIALGGIQIVATALIMICAARYQDTPCPFHVPGSPRPHDTRADGHPSKRVWLLAPGRAVRGSVPVPHVRSYAVTARLAGNRMPGPSAIAGLAPTLPGKSRPCTELQTTHLKGTT